MDKKLIIVLGVFLTVALCVAALYSGDSNHEEIPFKSIDDPDVQSQVLESIMENSDLVLTIETIDSVTIKPATVRHSVSYNTGIATVTIFDYIGQKFHVVIGDSSDVYLFGVTDKKKHDKKNKTVTIINDTSKKPKITIKLLSSEPDLTTFTEIFEVTNFEMYTPDSDLDFKARSVVQKGRNSVFKTEWFIEVNQSYVVNITDYKATQVKKEVYNNKTGKNETIFVNETVVSGYHDETRYRNVWSDYNKYGTTLAKNTIQKIKVVYHKKPELGDVRIQTVPVFAGVECEELTWWDTSWLNRVEKTINNASVALTDYQIMNVTAYDTDMNANFSDLRFTTGSGTLIPYWIESKTDSSTADIWLKIPSISTTTGAKVWMYYNNSAASSASSGDDTFIQWHGTSSSQFTDSYVIPPTNVIYEAYARQTTTGSSAVYWGVSNTANGGLPADDAAVVYFVNGNGYIRVWNEGTSTYEAHSITQDTAYHNWKIVLDGSSMHAYIDDVEASNGISTNLPNENMGLQMHFDYGGAGDQKHSFARKYTATEPTWAADGEEEEFGIITEYTPATPLDQNGGESQLFTVNTSENSQCRWYINGSLVQTNSTGATRHEYLNSSLDEGYWNFTAIANTTGMTSSQTWWVDVSSSTTYKPPEPTNLQHTTGNFWVNHTWQAGSGNATDGWNVSVNSVWHNRTYAWYNETYSPHAWQNISVWAWNSSGVGTLSD